MQVHLARVHAKVEFLKLMNWKIAWGVGKGLNRADASATKVFGSEMFTEAYRLLMEVLGQQAYVKGDSRGATLTGRLERMYRSMLILTFGGGTNEVQRDIISMVGLAAGPSKGREERARMDWGFTEEQRDLEGLARQIPSDRVTESRLREIESAPDRYDPDLYGELAKANLLGIAFPEAVGGAASG